MAAKLVIDTAAMVDHLVGSRVGPADIRLYEVGYAEGGHSANRAVDAGFDAGSAQWGVDGTGRPVTVPGDDGSGMMLRITAPPTDPLALGSPRFPVTPGAAYEFYFTAAVPIGSASSDYIGVVFLGEGGEVRRDVVDLAPHPIALGPAATDSDGRILLRLDGLAPGRYLVRASYPGDASRWPACAETEAQIG